MTPRYLYIARDKYGSGPFYRFCNTKMKKNVDSNYSHQGNYFCIEKVRRLTGISLKKGQQVRINREKLNELIEIVK